MTAFLCKRTDGAPAKRGEASAKEAVHRHVAGQEPPRHARPVGQSRGGRQLGMKSVHGRVDSNATTAPQIDAAQSISRRPSPSSTCSLWTSAWEECRPAKAPFP